jgi:hypothetical protein
LGPETRVMGPNMTSLLPSEPLADPKALVLHGSCRFTVLTASLIRCEYSAAGTFEDRPTLSVGNRRGPVPSFSVEKDEKGVCIRTERVTLRCTDTSCAFSSETLSADFSLGSSDQQTGRYKFGSKPGGNLGGTVRTLDGCHGGMWCHWEDGRLLLEKSKPVEVGPGLLSRDGWAVVDDSSSVALEERAGVEHAWCTARQAGPAQDLYLFLHGRDYAAALRDGAFLFGRQPLPPRWAFGYWFCRYWAYTDRELEALVTEHDRAGVPLDVLVIDMDWHQLGWTGYTWAREFFPDYEETLSTLAAQGLKLSLNLHPADGVSPDEERYQEFRKVMGEANAAKVADADGRIPFDCTDPHYMRAYFEVLHHPHERSGVDLWWMDWQQGTSSKLPGLDPLHWLNHLHWQDRLHHHPDKRPLIFSRYGGLGSGRKPVGFSGDTTSSWESLAYQPRFTAQSANVLFGHWSHDIGGHFSRPEPELYTRWLQFGAHSPVLRTHSTKTVGNERRIFDYPEPYRFVMAEAIARRYELVPYIASEWRELLETGESLLRPMYHESPEEDDAYRCPDQYRFGSQMIVAPVLAQVDAQDEQARLSVWLPAGDWLETFTGASYAEGWHQPLFLVDEYGVFVRKGAVLPGLHGASRLQPGSYPHLLLDAWPGADGKYELIEDDGVSQGYLSGQEVRVLLEQRYSGTTRSVVLNPARGAFDGFKPERPLRVRFHLGRPPRKVTVNGVSLPWSFRPQPGHFSYDGDTLTTIVDVESLDLRASNTISLEQEHASSLYGLPGLLRRLRRVMQLTLEVSYWRVVHPEERLAAELGQTGNRMSRRPDTFDAELANLEQKLPRLKRVLKEHQTALAILSDVNERPRAERVARARRILDTALLQFPR